MVTNCFKRYIINLIFTLGVYSLLVESKIDSVTAVAEALCYIKVPLPIIWHLEKVSVEYLDDHQSSMMSDITVSKILFTPYGRRAMKVGFVKWKINELSLLIFKIIS